jgi:hypothetical protein
MHEPQRSHVRLKLGRVRRLGIIDEAHHAHSVALPQEADKRHQILPAPVRHIRVRQIQRRNHHVHSISFSLLLFSTTINPNASEVASTNPAGMARRSRHRQRAAPHSSQVMASQAIDRRNPRPAWPVA